MLGSDTYQHSIYWPSLPGRRWDLVWKGLCEGSRSVLLISIRPPYQHSLATAPMAAPPSPPLSPHPPPPAAHTRSLWVSEKSQTAASPGKEWALGFQRGPHARRRVSGSAEARQSTRGRPGRSTAQPAATRPALRLARFTDALARPRKPGSPAHLPAPGLGLPAAALRGPLSEESAFLPAAGPRPPPGGGRHVTPPPLSTPRPRPRPHPPPTLQGVADAMTSRVACFVGDAGVLPVPWAEVRGVCSQNEREK